MVVRSLWTREGILSRSADSGGLTKAMGAVARQDWGFPVSPVEIAEGWRQFRAVREETSCQDSLPGPGSIRQVDPHGRRVGIGSPFGTSFDEVAPDGGNEKSLHDGIEPSAERGGFALVVCTGVAKEHVELVDWVHGSIAGHGLCGTGRTLGASDGIRMNLEANVFATGMRRDRLHIGLFPVTRDDR